MSTSHKKKASLARPGKSEAVVPTHATSSTQSHHEEEEHQETDLEEDITPMPPILNVIPSRMGGGPVQLFGYPIVTLPPPPKLNAPETFQSYIQEIETYAVVNNISYLMSLPSIESWQKAILFNSERGMSLPLLTEVYRSQHAKVIAILSIATIKVIPMFSSIIDSIKAEMPILGSEPTPVQKWEDAHVVWTKLRSMYEDHTAFNQLGLFRSLIALRYHDGDDPATVFDELYMLNTQLIQATMNDRPIAGQIFSESLKSVFIINALPKSMAPDIATILGRPTTSLAEVRGVMQRRWESHKVLQRSSVPAVREPVAYAANDEGWRQLHHSWTDSLLAINEAFRKSSEDANAPRIGDPDDEPSSSYPRSYERRSGRPQHTSQQQPRKFRKSGSGQGSSSTMHTMCLIEQPPPPCIPTYYTKEARSNGSSNGISDDRNAFRVVLDSGASRHTWFNSSAVKEQKTVAPIDLITASGKALRVNKLGSVNITESICIKSVAVVPSAAVNLMSVSKVTAAGYNVDFTATHARILTQTGSVLLTFKRAPNGLYVFDMSRPYSYQDVKDGFAVIKPSKPDNEMAPIQAPRAPISVKPVSSNTDVALPSPLPTSPRRRIPRLSAAAKAKADLQRARDASKARPSSNYLAEVVSALQGDVTEYDGLHFLGEVYHLATHSSEDKADGMQVNKEQVDAALKHRVFGHQSIYPLDDCDVCSLTRTRRTGIGRVNTGASTTPLSTIVADLMGPISVHDSGSMRRCPSLGGGLYVLVMLDEYTRYTWCTLLRTKAEAAETVINLLTAISTQHGHIGRVTRMHTDGGTEFVNSTLGDYLREQGIAQTYTTTGKPSHNGRAERLNQTLIRLIRSMLVGASAPSKLWGEALTYAAEVYNRTPLRVIDKVSPYEKLFGKLPDTSKLHTFGSNAWYALQAGDAGKFEPIYARGVWIGIEPTQNAHRVLNLDGELVVSRDVKVREDSHTHMHQLSGGHVATDEFGWSVSAQNLIPSDVYTHTHALNPEEPEPSIPSSPDHSSTPTTYPSLTTRRRVTFAHASQDSEGSSDEEDDNSLLSDQNPPYLPPTTEPTRTRSGRESIAPLKYGFGSTQDYDLSDQRVITGAAPTRTNPQYALAISDSERTPLTYLQAVNHPEAVRWKEAMDAEVLAMQRLEVFQIVPLIPGTHIITSRWVYKLKLDAHGLPCKWKARIVARGFEQIKELEYSSTFAPVCKYKSLRMLLAIAVQLGLTIHQLDFITAFLNAPLEEVIHMQQPQGYVVGGRSMVWRLRKAIYGLKQSPREWNSELDTHLQSLGYVPTTADRCIYTKATDTHPIMLSVYVDDTVVAFDEPSAPIWMADKVLIAAKYPITDLGVANWLLQMEINPSLSGESITLSQESYVDKLLDTFGMTNCKPMLTPAIVAQDLTNPHMDSKPLSVDEHHVYRSMVGALLYAANTTRLDISYTISTLSRFVAAPLQIHLTAAKHVLRYLRGTSSLKLPFRPLPSVRGYVVLSIYTDATWASDLTDRRSVSGLLVQINGNSVQWSAKRQTTVSLSSTEAEYLALSAGFQEAIWTLRWLSEVLPSHSVQTTIYSDNQSAIALIKSDAHSHRSKHIDTRHQFMSYVMKHERISLEYLPTGQQLADLLTKVQPLALMSSMRRQLLVE